MAQPSPNGLRVTTEVEGALLACEALAAGSAERAPSDMAGCVPRRRSTVQPDSGEVLLVGCEGSGKTLLARHLQRMCDKDVDAGLDVRTKPSVGTELSHLAHKRRAFTLREVGGIMLPLWPRYFDACNALVFVADTSDAAASGGAVIEWYNLLADARLQSKPALLLFNQRDRAQALPDVTLRVLFRLSELESVGRERQRAVTVLPVSALTGEGLPAVLDWITKHVAVR